MKHFRHLKLLLLIAFSVAISHFDALAYSFEVDGIYYSISGNNVSVTYRDGNYNSYSGDIEIPATVEYQGTTYNVTSIGNYAFYGCSSLTSVTIPNSVTSISNYAFDGCSSLTSVTIPNSVKKIGNYAFLGCSSLTSVTIPESVTSIGSSAFSGCSSMTSVTIGNSVTSIGKSAFSYCSSLTEVTIPNSVTSIGNFAFEGCSRLTSVTIPNSVTSIGERAFYGCSGLTSVTIPNSVTSIGNSAFYGCSNLTEFNGKYASEDHRCLIVNGVLNSFAPAGLTEYSIPNFVTSIGDNAFSSCSGLTSITIPNSVTSIGDGAFTLCTGLTTFNGKFASEDHRCLIVDGVLKAFAPAGLTEYSIPSSVTSIGYDAFYICSNLTSVTIPNSVTSIGDNAFSSCSRLTSIIIPNSVTSIGNWAFSGCVGLTSVTIPNSVTSIGDNAFYICRGLTSVTIPNSVTSIGERAFYYCKGLTSITIGNSITSIGDYTFKDCSGLTSIIIENPTPANISLGTEVFLNVPTSACNLYVPKSSVEAYKSANTWKNFKNIQAIRYTLNDAEVYAETADIDCIDIDYTRNFTNNTVWQCLYIPFDMSYEEWADKAQVAELNSFHEYDENEDGIIERLSVEYRTVKEGSLVPNVPYLIKPVNTGTVTFNCEGKILKAAPETEGYIDCSTTRHKYTLYGTYTGYANGELKSKDAYVIGASGFKKASASAALSPQRFYMVIENRNGGYWGSASPLQLPERIEVLVDGETVGIADVVVEREDGAYYDLQGRRIANPERGIFIHNGKKIIIK